MRLRKMNKKRVRTNLTRIFGGLTNLLEDKIGQPNTLVPMSVKVMLEMHGKINRAIQTLAKK